MEAQHYSYLRFTLRTPHLCDACKNQLEALGVECLDEGADFEAYGIVADEQNSDKLRVVPDVVRVETSAPPCSK